MATRLQGTTVPAYLVFLHPGVPTRTAALWKLEAGGQGGNQNLLDPGHGEASLGDPQAGTSLTEALRPGYTGHAPCPCITVPGILGGWAGQPGSRSAPPLCSCSHGSHVPPQPRQPVLPPPETLDRNLPQAMQRAGGPQAPRLNSREGRVSQRVEMCAGAQGGTQTPTAGTALCT